MKHQMKSHADVDIIGEFADRLVTVEMRNRAMNHGIIPTIYNEARRNTGGRPLSSLAAECLVSNAGKGDVVFLSTGAGYPPEMPHGENDGPPGVAVLARALYYGFGIVPVFLVEDLHAKPVIASSESAGVSLRSLHVAQERGFGGSIVELSSNATPEEIGDVFDTYKPKAFLSSERLGPNENGITNYSTAAIVHDTVLNFGHVIDAAKERGVPTVGIGDNGNEVGFGAIFDFMSRFHPFGKDNNPLSVGGVPTVAATDVLFPCSISNWGCYAVATVLGYIADNPDLIHTPEMERRILMDCLDADGYEARYCSRRFILDGVEGESSLAIVQLLRNMLALNLAKPDRGPAH
jgi:hypothetical protein